MRDDRLPVPFNQNFNELGFFLTFFHYNSALATTRLLYFESIDKAICKSNWFAVPLFQCGQSRGQHDWVRGFPESVKSFITFVILSQISCCIVQNKPHIFLHKTVSKFLLGLL